MMKIDCDGDGDGDGPFRTSSGLLAERGGQSGLSPLLPTRCRWEGGEGNHVLADIFIPYFQVRFWLVLSTLLFFFQ